MYGGVAGVLAPLAVFLGGVGWLALAGAPDERGFWPVLLAALTTALLLARDRRRASDVMLAGMAQPLVLVMVTAWLLAGVLSTLLSASGFVEALAAAVARAEVGGGIYVALAFVLCALVATSTGTSFGTILVGGPLLYPAGASAGADPAWLIGAILAGATFGDSISPVSDTTIASAGTQAADIGGTVRARLKYVMPAGLIALVVYAFVPADTVAAAAQTTAPPPRPYALVMLLVPLLVIAMLFARRHLVEALLGGALAATIVGLLFGLIAPGALLRVEPGSFAAESLIIDGMERAVGVTVFTLLLVALMAIVDATGTLQRLVDRSQPRAAHARATEGWIVGAASAAVMLTTHSVVAVLTVGPFARAAGAKAGIGAYRRANMLDLTVCTWPFLFPWFLPPILAASTTASGAAMGMPRMSPLTAGMFNVYSWALVIVIAVVVARGWGRGEGGEAMPRA